MFGCYIRVEQARYCVKKIQPGMWLSMHLHLPSASRRLSRRQASVRTPAVKLEFPWGCTYELMMGAAVPNVSSWWSERVNVSTLGHRGKCSCRGCNVVIAPLPVMAVCYANAYRPRLEQLLVNEAVYIPVVVLYTFKRNRVRKEATLRLGDICVLTAPCASIK
ncbi:hypothetical protein BDW22DRAFT_648485 [Trametopsis cervina]|nr:hypothetical protein BDW22DRAFT_648485 [Trametopsis cervina]